jgi:hypothetical protein
MLSKVRENDYDTIVAHAALSGASDLQEPARIEPPAWALTPSAPGNFCSPVAMFDQQRSRFILTLK